MDSKLYIKNKIRNQNSEIDLSEGSAVTNLLVNPLSTIMQPLLDEQDKLINNLSLIVPDAIEDGDVDAVSANFLVTRREALKATGTIKFFYTSPIAVSIPKDTLVSTADNVMFKTTMAYTILKSDMASNIEDYPLYSTDDITIEAVALGDTGNVLAGSIEKIISSFFFHFTIILLFIRKVPKLFTHIFYTGKASGTEGYGQDSKVTRNTTFTIKIKLTGAYATLHYHYAECLLSYQSKLYPLLFRAWSILSSIAISLSSLAGLSSYSNWSETASLPLLKISSSISICFGVSLSLSV